MISEKNCVNDISVSARFTPYKRAHNDQSCDCYEIAGYINYSITNGGIEHFLLDTSRAHVSSSKRERLSA